ncbi:MAG TPA: DUF6493 family protein [Solirubrobacteraceae bacterium]
MAALEELHALAGSGGAEAVERHVMALPEAERRKLAPGLVKLMKQLWRDWDWSRGSAPRTVDHLVPAALACMSLAQLRDVGHLAVPMWDHQDAAHRILRERRPGWLQEWAEWIVGEWPSTWSLVRGLMKEGLIERPRTDGYVLAFVALQDRASRGDRSLRQALEADPDLLEHEVWRIFEVEGGGDLSLAAIDKYSGGYDDELTGWAGTLKAFADEGTLDRDRLLDASLDALGRDFSSFRAGWYSRFHETLEPTVEERVARLDAYLRLVGSSIANTASFALKAVEAVDKAGALPASADLPERLAPALASERKGTVKKALALLERAAGREPALRETVALAACEALAHEEAEVQGRALALIGTAPGPEVGARLLELADSVAPTMRDRLAEVTGLEVPGTAAAAPSLAALEERAAALPAALRASAGVDAALDALREGRPPPAAAFSAADAPVTRLAEPVAPIEDLGDLIEAAGALAEGVLGAEEAERVLDGIARLCAERPSDFGERVSSLRRRAKRLADEEPDLASLLRAWVDGTPPPAGVADMRIREIAARVATGDARPLLSAPTHRGGWIAPAALVERAQEVPEPGFRDLVQALCRVAPDGREEARDALATAAPAGPSPAGPSAVPAGEARAALLLALGGEADVSDEALRAAALLGRDLNDGGPRFRVAQRLTFRLPHVGALPDPMPSDRLRGLVPALGVGIPDDFEHGFFDALPADAGELALRRPGGHDAFWAHAVNELAALEWGAGGDDLEAAFLEPALDPDRPLGELGALAIALGLTRAHATVRAAAVDGAIVAIADGRLDGAGLGAALRVAVAEPHLAVQRRFGPSLRTVAAESPLHSETVRVALEEALNAFDEAPREIHALLDALNEVAADAQAAVADPGARRLLESIGGKTKAARLAKELLQREGTSRHAPVAAALAAEACVARAERWAAATRR